MKKPNQLMKKPNQLIFRAVANKWVLHWSAIFLGVGIDGYSDVAPKFYYFLDVRSHAARLDSVIMPLR